MRKHRKTIILIIITLVCTVTFIFMYKNQTIQVDSKIPDDTVIDSKLENWTVEKSVLNGLPLVENKDIYSDGVDASIYDVYISAFPTEDENGKVLDFSAFDLHKARDHTYNPVLNCNIQILNEDEKIDPLTDINQKNATLRVRGNSSRSHLYKSYKVKLDKETKSFKGQYVLNINKHSKDISKITTKFCADMLAKVPNILSYRTNFMRIWIRDTSLPKDKQEFKYYGLYTHTEQPNNSYLEARSLSSNCEMYKARDFSFAKTDEIKNVDEPNYDEVEFETVLNIREAQSHDKLLELLDALADTNRDFNEVFDTYFNEENYLTWLGFNIIMGADDILNHNYIIYSPVNTKTWYLIPWDFDSDLDDIENEIFALPAPLKGGQKLNMSTLHRRFFAQPGNIDKLKAKMDELMSVYFNEANTIEVINQYIPVLEKTIMLEPDLSLLILTPNETYEYVKRFPEIINKKYNNFNIAFEYPSPMYVSKPVKNEDGTLHLAWQPSYSYQGRTIKYKATIYDNYNKDKVLYTKDNIISTEIDTDIKLESGTYYLDVRAIDSNTNEQYSLEHFEFSGDLFVYKSGLLEFKIE